MGSGINNKINEFICNPKNVKKRRNTRLEKCYGQVNIATAFINCETFAKNREFVTNKRVKNDSLQLLAADQP